MGTIIPQARSNVYIFIHPSVKQILHNESELKKIHFAKPHPPELWDKELAPFRPCNTPNSLQRLFPTRNGTLRPHCNVIETSE